MKIALSKNMVITCPECNQCIALVKHDIYHGDSLFAESFEYPTYKYKNGDMATCFKCGKFFYDVRTNKLHTSKGWMPDDTAKT